VGLKGEFMSRIILKVGTPYIEKRKVNQETRYRLAAEITVLEKREITENSLSSDEEKEMSKGKAVKGKTVKEETVKEETVKEETVKEETVKEEIVKKETVKEETVKEETESCGKRVLYYEVDEEYGTYLEDTSGDAFLVALLYYCMWFQYDMELEGTVSGTLLYQLRTYFIPILSDSLSFFHPIQIYANEVECKVSTRAEGVATGLTGGVDSFYTIHRYLQESSQRYRLTHLLLTNYSAFDTETMSAKEWFTHELDNMKSLAAKIGLPLIAVRTNLQSAFPIPRSTDQVHGKIEPEGLFTLRFASHAFALKKLIGIYYFSSGFGIDQFTIHPKPYDTAAYDIFNLFCVSTEEVAFYSAGMEKSRLGKIKAIADWKIAQENLKVCNMLEDRNCGQCKKCIRTQMELYTLGKLYLFNKVFDLPRFQRKFVKYAGQFLAHRNQPFEKKVLEEMKEKRIKLPLGSALESPLWMGMDYLADVFRDRKWARKIYHHLKLDVFRVGMATKNRQHK
jgi:hypothetical protein